MFLFKSKKMEYVQVGNHKINEMIKKHDNLAKFVNEVWDDFGPFKFFVESSFSLVCVNESNTVVLKFLKTSVPYISHFFQQELANLLRLNTMGVRNNLIRIFSEDNVHLIVQHHCGEDALEMTNNYVMCSSRWISCMQQLIPVLNTIHSKGMAHMDIKPENMCFDSKTNHWNFIDWGLAKKFGVFKKNVRGTVPYICPAILNKSYQIVDEVFDIYSFSITLVCLYENLFSGVCNTCKTANKTCKECYNMDMGNCSIVSIDLSLMYNILESSQIPKPNNYWTIDQSENNLAILKSLCKIVLSFFDRRFKYAYWHGIHKLTYDVEMKNYSVENHLQDFNLINEWNTVQKLVKN